MQGLILKASASGHSHPKHDGRVTQQAGSSRIPNRYRSTFNGKRVSNPRSHRDTDSIVEKGKLLEDAFWNNKSLTRRKVTSAEVLTAYGNDWNTLRSGFFLQKLCLKNILHGNRKVTPDQVIQEFNRVPDRNKKYKLAIARFKAECCLRGLALHGQQVTPDEVVKVYQAVKAALELARFKEQCYLRSWTLNGVQVTADAVVKDYQASGATLELSRFKAECCLRSLPMNGQQVTTDAVVKDYQAVRATLELARFKAECCLRNLPVNGQQVTADEVVKDYQVARATLELARFKAECCLRGRMLNGQLVTADAVVKDFPDSPEGKLGRTRFKAECFLRGVPLHGQQLTPGSVVNDFRDSPEGRLGLALFKEQCCLRGLALNGEKVTPDAVIKGFPGGSDSKLAIIRFKEECCLRGLALNGQQVTPDVVVKDYQAARAILELGRFKAECCLKGLALNGRQVTPEAVVESFPESPEGKLGIARFKAECCLRGLALNGQQITPGTIVKEYQATSAALELARFKAECCLKGLALNGQQVRPDGVVRDFPDSPEAKLGVARFKAECCLRGWALDDQQVTPDGVVKDFPASPEGMLGIARFKEQCCLKGLPLNGQEVTTDAVFNSFPNSQEGKLGIACFKSKCCLRGLVLHGQQVTPDEVVKEYERGGWLLDRAIFYVHLALNARALNGNYLDNREVLAAFNEVPGDHSSRQAEYLLQRLAQSTRYDETNKAQDILQEAWQILNNLSVKDDKQHRLQCILAFMAMQHGLPMNQQRVSAEQVLQSIKTLRGSFQNSRLHFFFLAHCYINSQSVNGRQIHKDQVLKCIQDFPEGSKLRHALSYWFEQYSPKANIMGELLFQRGKAVAQVSSEDHVSHEPVSIPGREGPFAYQVRESCNETENTSASQAVTASSVQTVKPWSKEWSKTDEPGVPDSLTPKLNALTLKTLEIIQEINGSYSNPRILITGSYARFLQNRCSLFNDIDIICTTEDSARTLFNRLQALNTDKDSDIPNSIIISPIPGCQAIKLPSAYNIDIKDGDLATRAMDFQVSVDARVTHCNEAQLTVNVPGVERPVWHLSFAEETRLLNDTLEYLAENLDPLTEQLQKGVVFQIPRTILFNFPRNSDELIYGLLMRYLLTLSKARQFIALHSEVKPDDSTHQLQKEQQRLHALTVNLQTKLTNHDCRNDFEFRVNDWLSTTQPVNGYEIKRKDFVKALLAMMHPE